MTEPREPTPEHVLLDASIRLLDVQISTFDVLDVKNSSVVGVSSTVLPLAFGLLAIQDREIPTNAKWTLVAAIVFYALVLACAWWASRIRALEYRPHLPTLQSYTHAYDGDLLQEWVADEYVSSTLENAKPLRTKARLVGWANTFFFAEGVCLAAAAALTLL